MDPNSWFCQVNGQQYGPYTPAQLKHFVGEGRLQTTSLVRQAISNNWIPASSVPGLFGPGFPVTAPPGAPAPAYHATTSAPSTAFAAPSLASGDNEVEDRPLQRKNPIVLFTLIALAALFIGGVGFLLLVQLSRKTTTAVVEPETENDAEMEVEQVHISPKQIQAALDSVPHWTDALSTTKLGAKSFRFEMDVWSGKDKQSRSGDRFIYIQMKVFNPDQSGHPLHYLTWNRSATSAKMPTAVMVDSQGQLCPLSSAFAPGSAGEEELIIQPGENVTDVMAFAYPKGDFDYVNLALSYEAVDQGKRYFGFKIPRSMIGDEQRDASKAGRSGIAKTPKGGSGDKEPSLEAINRQAERDVKRQKKERMKNSE